MNIVFNDSSYTDATLARIDALCDAARLGVVGDAARIKEYERTEAQARQYKAQGYPADVPTTVKSAQQAKWREGWTAQQACDDIIAAADRWLAALDAIRDLRLKAKEDVRAASGKGEIDAAMTAFTTTLSGMMEGVA